MHRHLPRPDGGGLRLARPGAAIGRTAVNYANAIGLVLAIGIALFLVAALLFPERF
ncbi:MAG: potassium-transporting ATPase subunit F [Mycolicibacterium sp.]|nr:potassium-transporting ATPase subunit F [Mycolicibacterium sp.]